jgi:hypothetical protein
MDSIRIDVEGVRDTVALLRKIEPEAIKQLRAEITTEPALTAAVSSIKSRIPTVSPLQGNEFGYGGMIHGGRTSYRPPSVKIKTPLRTNLRGRNQASLVVIDVASPPKAVGFEIIDMVGRGPNANSRKAVGMRRKLPGNPSRYVWKGFEAKAQGIENAVNSILKKYADKVNVKLRVG